MNEDSHFAFYFDLHGHCTKRGCFIYGNWLETEDKMVDNVLYALLVGVNSIYFDFDSCNFSLRNMYQKDRKGNSTKEGAGRVALWKHLGLTHCYTVECNYNSGPLPSRLSRFIASEHPNDSKCFTPIGAFYGPHWSDMVNTASSQSLNFNFDKCSSTNHTNRNGGYKTLTGVPHYTPAHYEDVGRALMIAILDFNQINPWPKLASLSGSKAESNVGIPTVWPSLSEFLNINTLKEWVRKYIRGITPTNIMTKSLITQNTESFISNCHDTDKSQTIHKALTTTNENLNESRHTSTESSEFSQNSLVQIQTNPMTIQSNCNHCSYQLNPISHNFKWNNNHQNDHQLHDESDQDSCKSSISNDNNNKMIINVISHKENRISSNLLNHYIKPNSDIINKPLLDLNIENNNRNLLTINKSDAVNDDLIDHKLENNDKLVKITPSNNKEETSDKIFLMKKKKTHFLLNARKIPNEIFNQKLNKQTKYYNSNNSHSSLSIEQEISFNEITDNNNSIRNLARNRSSNIMLVQSNENSKDISIRHKKRKSTITENRYSKKCLNEKIKHMNLRKCSLNGPCHGFSYTESGFTKHLINSANINHSTVINTKNKPLSAQCKRLQKSKNDKIFSRIASSSIKHQRSRSSRQKSVKTPYDENALQSPQSNVTNTNNSNDSETNCQLLFDNSNINTDAKIKENTVVPLVNRSNSLTDLKMIIKSEDCIKEIQEMFRSVTLS
ncbi:unnamed protein product [Schistosoma turkestanicum]|nr:unnamed protein product [Schistosoma turkestanicum]